MPASQGDSFLSPRHETRSGQEAPLEPWSPGDVPEVRGFSTKDCLVFWVQWDRRFSPPTRPFTVEPEDRPR